MALTDRNIAQMGNVRPHVRAVAEELTDRWPVAFLWGKNNGTSGEHPLGLALDFSVLSYGGGARHPGPADMAKGRAIANYLWANRKRLNVWYVIWDRRIISTTRISEGWRPYTGHSDHRDHVHVSFNKTGVYHPPQEDDMPSANEVARAVLFSDVIENIGNKANPKMTLAGAIADMERTQDLHGRELAGVRANLATLRAAVAALGKGLGPTVEAAVEEALKDAVIHVDVDVNTEGNPTT